ncbi:MAG TPA: hydrogenase maturation protease [Streptosporangiaceae bacterium]|nr:hydrogenase maturation protease [Streptosporangiaceae bacterium]
MNQAATGAGAGGPAGEPGGNRAVVVIGVGNEFRRDDGAGPEVLARLRDQVADNVRLVVSDGEPARLIEAWAGASLALVVDAVRADPVTPGRIHRLVLDQAGAEHVRPVSSHGLGLGEAIGLARALNLMPDRLIVHAVEAAEFGFGVGLTPAVAAATDALTSAVLHDLATA